MTITRKHEEFTTSSGQAMFLEQYHEKEWNGDVWLWRYGTQSGYIWGDYLLTKPNKKRIIARY